MPAWGGPRPFLKICGIRNALEARSAVAAGATALGFLVGLTHRADDALSEAEATAIVTECALTHPVAAAGTPNARPVLVTHLLDPASIAALADRIGVAAIQVHGDVLPDALAVLRALLPTHHLIKAIHVTGPEALDRAAAYAKLADALLLDTRTADRLGGTGRTHDWSISRRIVASVAPTPVILAGGLTPDNVAAAIAAVRPAGVDVNSGVEDETGAKDPRRMKAFLAAARAALPATGTR